jgi:hypothetical protein
MKIFLFCLLNLIGGFSFSQTTPKDSLCFHVGNFISINDKENWGIKCSENCQIHKFNFQLFSRWGVVLFEVNSIDEVNAFDPFENSKSTFETGTYYWRISFSLMKDKNQYIQEGSLTIKKY